MRDRHQQSVERPKVTIGCGCGPVLLFIAFLVSLAYMSEIKGCVVDIATACRGEAAR